MSEESGININIIDGDRFDHLHLESSDTENVKIVNNHAFTLNGALFAFQLSDKVKNLITGNSGINAIHIIPLLDMSIDEHSNKFGEYLTEIIKHIIFKDQTCVDNLIVVTTNPTYLAIGKECIANNSRVISSTAKRFPIEEDTLFDNEITGFNSVTSLDDHESWWIQPGTAIEEAATRIFEPRHEGDYPPKKTDIIDGRGYKAYLYEVKIHKWIFNIKKTYSKNAGNLYSSMTIGEDTITAYYYEKGALIPETSGGSDGGGD
jgi:hypothetical protein